MFYEIQGFNERIYRFLIGNGLARSGADYSRRFLGRSRTYLNVLRKLDRDPSPICWKNLTDQLNSLLEQPLHDQTRQALADLMAEIHDHQSGGEVRS